MIKKNSTDLKPNAAPAEYFTGKVTITPLVKNEGIPVNTARVSFQPGARTNWHTHPVGQILIVTEGSGFVQKKGEPIQEIHPGDVVTILADEEHWHGAQAGRGLTHIAVQVPNESGVEAVWLKPVSDEEYGLKNL
jgi:quercetin dioxygenase-like cupin family protein